jgi:hypothetical protein
LKRPSVVSQAAWASGRMASSPGVGDGFAAVEAGDERGWTEAGEALLLLVEEEAGFEEGEQRALVGDDDEVDAGVHGAEGFELLHGFAPAG